MKVVTRLRIGNEQIYMGAGVRQLLDAVDQYHSIKKACEVTKISYPKALRMVKTFHQETGFPAVVSEKGGKDFGGTQLTPEGRAVLEAYREMETKVQAYAQQLVESSTLFG